jgi:hypothetical protein
MDPPPSLSEARLAASQRRTMTRRRSSCYVVDRAGLCGDDGALESAVMSRYGVDGGGGAVTTRAVASSCRSAVASVVDDRRVVTRRPTRMTIPLATQTIPCHRVTPPATPGPLQERRPLHRRPPPLQRRLPRPCPSSAPRPLPRFPPRRRSHPARWRTMSARTFGGVDGRGVAPRGGDTATRSLWTSPS